jgi:hypothetical protein
VDDINAVEWDTTKKVAERYNKDGVFTTFWGFEWTGNEDVAVINTDDNINWAGTSGNFTELCAWLNTRNGVAFFNHPGRSSNNEFGKFATTPTDKIVGIELFNQTNGFSKYYYNDGFYPNDGNLNCFSEANSRGWRIGASGSDDNHEATWGKRVGYRMAILANNLTRSELFEALQARRFYSTLDKNLALSFKFGVAEMGSILESGTYNMHVQASDKDGESFTRVMLFRNGLEMKTWEINTPAVDLSFTINAFNGEFFYVKVTQADGDEAVSSPVFIKGGAFNSPPSCIVSSPGNGSHFNSPQLISITSDASDTDGSVFSVEFFVNGNSVGSDNLPPYSVNYTIPSNGAYTIAAKAKDDTGCITTSVPVKISVGVFSETIVKGITNGSDDVEEIARGHYMPASSDIEFDQDLDEGSNNKEWAALRFTEVNIPKGATISVAKIQFTSKNVYDPAYPECKVYFKIENSDNSEAFSEEETVGTQLYQVRSRVIVKDSVLWNVPQWITADETDIDELSPDLKKLVQAVVNCAGWTYGNAICFIISGKGTGWRNTRSYEANPAKAAKLTISYIMNYVGIPETSVSVINIYPNPVMDQLNIQGLDKVKKLVIIDITGKVWRTVNINSDETTLNINELHPGMYFLKAGNQTFKFIKK